MHALWDDHGPQPPFRRGPLDAKAAPFYRRTEGPSPEPGVLTLLELPDARDIRRLTAVLCFQRYGGSGFNFTPASVHAMQLSDILWYYDWLNERWEDENKALSKK